MDTCTGTAILAVGIYLARGILSMIGRQQAVAQQWRRGDAAAAPAAGRRRLAAAPGALPSALTAQHAAAFASVRKTASAQAPSSSCGAQNSLPATDTDAAVGRAAECCPACSCWPPQEAG
jgi:hypothetical protein